jgi:hypothetical protein
MGGSVLNFDSEKQTFNFDDEVVGETDFRRLALEQLFNEKKSYALIKNFIDKDLARKIRDYYSKTETSKSFVQAAEGSNFRIFYYQNSPFKYPKFIKSLLGKCMAFKNKIYQYHDFYQTYCLMKNVDPTSHEEVARIQDLHSWSSVYWYKNGNSHYKHIDNYGELACFLILSQKGEEYESGGLKVHRGGDAEDIDELCEYGDLLFLDQSKVFHEVLPVRTSGNQIGRLNIYIPTIPPNYMKKVLVFEGHPYRVFFTNEDISCGERIGCWFQNILRKEKVHYSRKTYKHFEDRLKL